MKQNTAKVLSVIMLIVSVALTAGLAASTVLSAIIVKAIPPVICMLIFTVCWGWIDLHYLRCCRYLKHEAYRTKKIQRKLQKQSKIFTLITGMFAFSALLVSTYLLVMFGVEGLAVKWFPFYLLAVGIVFAAYTVSGALNQKALEKPIER